MQMTERSPGLTALMLLVLLTEIVWRMRSERGYDRRGALTTLRLAAVNIPIGALNVVVLGAIFSAAWRIAPSRLPLDDWRTWVAGFLAFEFAYYWFHRASHRIRWLWATHVVHHTSEQITLLASLRLGWTSLLSAGWVFYVPLIFAGFDPRLIFAMLLINLRFQFWLHTEAIGRLGPLEWVFNTPAHHRLHHASNDCYVDRNFGGVLILFDRLFGTFVATAPGVTPRYGLASPAASHKILRLAFDEWRAMIRAARAARSPGAALRALITLPPHQPSA